MKEGFTGERSIVLPMMTREMEANDPLVASLYITDIGYYPHADSHFRQRREPIGEHVLIYCMEGAGWFILDDMKYDVRANQYFILPPNKPHAYAAEREHPWTIYWIHFTGPHAAIYSEGADTPQDILPAVNSRISERNHIFEEIFSTLSRSTDIESLRYASSLLHYYLASMHYLRHYRHNEGNTVLSDVVAAAIHYMHENMEHRITLDQIASFTGYSPSRFSSIFRQQTGKSPLAYYNEMKINRARQLLDTTSMHVNQICHKVGIDDSYYFSRLFSKLVGMSPKQYRARRDSGRNPSHLYGS